MSTPSVAVGSSTQNMSKNVATRPTSSNRPESSNDLAVELLLACQNDESEKVESLIKTYGVDVTSSRDQFNRTALHYATEAGAIKSSELLLFHNPQLLNETDIDGCSALHGSVIAGNLPAIKWLVKQGASPNSKDNEDHTVLHWATVSAQPEIIEYLIREVKTSPQPDAHHAYPLHYAAQMCGANNNASSINDNNVSGTQGLTTQQALLTLLRLVECGHPLDCNDEDKRQPLIWAANNGAAEACYVLVNAGADVNADDKDGLTALHCSATRGHTRCLTALLRECKARPDSQDSNKCTPLFYAATFGHLSCCRILVDNGANVNHADRKQRTAAHCAASKGFLDCLIYLISAGGDLWKRSLKGDYPISEAIANGHIELVNQLLVSFTVEQRKELSKVRKGRTPLHSAAAANQLELCKVLIDIGSQLNALHFASFQYYSPYDFAVIRGNVEVAEYLRARGAAPASKIVKETTRVIQKYYRAWHARKKSPVIKESQSRPKSVTPSERGIWLEPIESPPKVNETGEEKAKKSRPTRRHSRPLPIKSPDSKASRKSDMAGEQSTNQETLLNASADFFGDDETTETDYSKRQIQEPKKTAEEPKKSEKTKETVEVVVEHQSNAPVSSPAKEAEPGKIETSANVNAVAPNTEIEPAEPIKPTEQKVTTTESTQFYEESPQDGVRVAITSASSKKQPTAENNTETKALADLTDDANNQNPPPTPRSIDTSSKASTPTPREDDEKSAQKSYSIADSMSIREEDDDGVESLDGVEVDQENRRRALEKDSGTNNSVTSHKPNSASTNTSVAVHDPVDKNDVEEEEEEEEDDDEAAASRPALSRAQSSTKSVRIMETPIIMDEKPAEDDYSYQPRVERTHTESIIRKSDQRVWVDALGRAHQSSIAMKSARPLQRLRMKSSIIRVKSVSEQVRKNVTQYEKQRQLIEDLKRLKRIQISKRNGVDQQYVTKSFSAIAKRNTMIKSTGGIDDAEKLLYDELYRRKLTEYRYIPEYYVEPPNDFAIFQVHNPRIPQTTTTPWSATVRSHSRATSAPIYEISNIRRHYAAATRRINHDMMQRVEKAYVPQPHIQQLLDKEEQQVNSSRSSGFSPRLVAQQGQVTGMSSTNASWLATSPYGESIRPHTSPGKAPDVPSNAISTPRGAPVSGRSSQKGTPSPRNRENTAPGRKPAPSMTPQRTKSPPVSASKRTAGQQQQQQQQQTSQRAGSAHSPHMQPLLASLIEPKHGHRSSSQMATSENTRKGSANLPEV